ncbi:efflux RND transporter periplasmic adaptor subunit [uncultured Rikenella sp.]|uniref:efflux RND transporter periplasmic adaptor subunit n=1 Tax=uncultured Rikenella sp. TaxID=368003 RepID=UPI00261E8748|nr:efflux RND transporter periplasmic adaptor subunit [uncultured Rikenella sp.]
MAKKNKKKRRLIIWGSLLLIVLLLVAGKKSGLLWPKPLEQVTLGKPQVRTIVELISANGRVQPVSEVKISPDVSGEIVELNIEEGQQVQKGMLLLKIKPDTYQSMQERAEATLNSSKAQLEQARSQLMLARQTYERQKQLFEQKAIPEADYQSAEAQYRSLQAQVRTAEFNIRSAEASLKEAEENLYKTTIFAPSGGTISKLNVELGERVVGTATMAGTEMLRIADLSQMEVRADVNENDIVRVALGDTAVIEVDAYIGRKFKGVVTRIANTATGSGTTSSDQVTNFEVRIYILPESYADLVQDGDAVQGLSPFRPGMSATVDIQTDTRHTLSVPIQAVTTRPGAENKEVVFAYRADSSQVRILPVKTGIQDKQFIEVSGQGIDTTVQVVTAPFTAISKKLTDGQQVQPVVSLTEAATTER